jgi:hypothetical protein
MTEQIVNVPDLCEQLLLARQAREDTLTSGTLAVTQPDLLAALADANFLAGSVQAVDDWLAKGDGTEYEQITVLEANALLASAQNVYAMNKADAFARRLDRLRQSRELYRRYGVLDDQLKLVGILADSPAQTQMSSAV